MVKRLTSGLVVLVVAASLPLAGQASTKRHAATPWNLMVIVPLSAPSGNLPFAVEGAKAAAQAIKEPGRARRQADRVAVMRLGQKVADVDVRSQTTTGTDLVALMTGAAGGDLAAARSLS